MQEDNVTPEVTDLTILSRAELDTMAVNVGLDPKQYGNKTQVIDALEDEGSETTETTDATAPEKTTKKASSQQDGHPVLFDETGNPIYN